MGNKSPKTLLNKISGASLVFLTVLSLTGCPTNDPYAPSPYDSGYGYDYDRDEYRRRRDYERRKDIERERERLEDERERLERERERHIDHHYDNNEHTYRPPPRREEHCPSGYSPSERKCSAEERRHGCKDMRLPGGLGCVSR